MDNIFKYINQLLGRSSPLTKKELEKYDESDSNTDEDKSGDNNQVPERSGGIAVTEDASDKTEDPVSKDIERAKSFVGEVVGKVEKVTGPKVSGITKSLREKLSNFNIKGKFNLKSKSFKIILGILIFVILLSGLAYGAISIIKKSVNGSKQNGGQITSMSTPTPLSFRPYKPSIYAGDEEIMTLEEDLEILRKEISGTNIRENILEPPQLDFKIEF